MRIIAFMLAISVGAGVAGAGAVNERLRDPFDPYAGVIYQIFPRSFADSNGDGVGDLLGIISKLDYVASLGAAAIWLTPIHPSPSYHGYDVVDYRAIHPDLGSMDDFDALVAAAHARGIRIILDLVVNHSSSQHPWFQAALRRDPEFSNWYRIEENPATITGIYGGNAWHATGDGRRYLGLFTGNMPDLNHTHAPVTDEMLDIASFWIARGVDGFRVDAIQHVVESADGVIANAPENFLWVRDFGDRLRARHPGVFLIGETVTSTPMIARYHREAHLDMSYDDPLWRALLGALLGRSAIDLRAQLEFNAQAYPDDAWRGIFVSNHDQLRPASVLAPLRPDPSRAALLGELMLALPGTPFLYYGEEIGMPNGPGNDDRGKRTPMRWTATADGGFTSATPYIAPSTLDPSISVEAQSGDDASVLERYRRAIALRFSHPALARGDARPMRQLPSALLGVWREAEGETPVLVVANVGTRSIALDADALAIPVDALTLTRLHDDARLPREALGEIPALTLWLFQPTR